SFDDFPTALNVVLTDPGCSGEENGGIQVASVEGGTAPYVYSLEGSVFSPQTLYTGLASGSYTLTVQDAFGCELELPITLEAGQDVLLELGEDQSIDYGESVQIIGQTNLNEGEIAYIEWEPADTAACDTCLFWEDQPLESTLYVATLTDTSGCTATDEMRVIVRRDRDIYIPNAFSPNTDGKNDLFTVFTGPEVVSVRSLQIFDRWGNQVFSREQFPPNDPAYGWDGRFRGQAMDIGYFVYFVEVEFVDGQVVLYEGGVHLVK
ncbi:MAG: T9SS type B sorting domain-containing protein, partial [Bacteroidetes bacterium]|nr:T9SS type B sorting domain-containing protein [Bacteroidota bacterium]